MTIASNVGVYVLFNLIYRVGLRELAPPFSLVSLSSMDRFKLATL